MTPKQFITKVRNYIFVHSANAGLFNSWSDEKYLKFLFKRSLGYELNLDNPRTFNEKIQWLKLHDRNPLYTSLVDKYEVKKYVADLIGEEHIIPTLGVWDNADEIDFDSLPNQFVLKCTHDSGGIVICTDKASLDIDAAKKKLNSRLKVNYFWANREWPYKNVKPRIIAEKYLENSGEGLHDYKVWCFNGKPEVIQYVSGRITDETYDAFFNADWTPNEIVYHNPTLKGSVPKPACLEEMLNAAQAISSNIPFARCDFYILEDGSLLIGEITFYPMSGLEPFKPDSIDKQFGTLLNINI